MYYWDDKIKEEEMGRVCGKHGRKQQFIQDLVGEGEGKRFGECPGYGL